MLRREWLLFVGGTALASGLTAHAGAQPPMCPPVVAHEIYNTPVNARIPQNGGVLVSPRFDHIREDGVRPSAYEFEQNGRSAPLAVQMLAPGLKRLTFPRGTTGPVIVRGPAGERAFELTTTTGTPPAAPHIERLITRPEESPFRPPGSATFLAKVSAGVPAGIVALIVYRAEPTFAKCFAVTTTGARELFLYRPRTHCDGAIDGENPVSIGDVLRIAYVDSVGGVSNQSNHLTVPRA